MFNFSVPVLPTLSGFCDHSNFHILVEYGSQGRNFQTLVGYQELTSDLSEDFDLKDNRTHFSFVVPFMAKNAAFEVGLGGVGGPQFGCERLVI